MSPTQWRLLGSAATLDSLKDGIKAFYCGEYISLITNEEATSELLVCNTRGVIDGVRVIKRGKRYRFERLITRAKVQS